VSLPETAPQALAPASQAQPAELEPAPLLPPELPWLYVVIPLPAAYLVGHDLLERPGPVLLRSLAKMYLPFAGYGLAFHLLYRFVMPRLLARVTAPWARWALHVGAVLLLTPLVAVLLLPGMRGLGGERHAFGEFLAVSFIFAFACVLPAVGFQGLRARARAAEHRALVQRQAALEAQLSALRARTDPHFLFNSLNTVASLISENPELAERTLERLADLFRYALDASRQRTVRLEQELSMVTDYLALQTARFGQRLHTTLDVERGLGAVELPPLLLQPLVENAIVHGALSRREGRVDVAVRREQDELVIEVKDDGPGPGGSVYAGAGTGVSVLRERLGLHYSGRGSLRLEPLPDGGCVARLAVPIGALP
jgi:two-component system sensor histidine kinase AlgZ